LDVPGSVVETADFEEVVKGQEGFEEKYMALYRKFTS